MSTAEAQRKSRPVSWKGKGYTRAPRAIHAGVRISEPERSRIAAKANAAQMTFSDYIRVCALGPGGPRAKRKPPVEVRELARVLAELNHWGGNLNQLSKVANTNGDLPAARSLAQLKEILKANRRDLLKALGRDY